MPNLIVCTPQANLVEARLLVSATPNCTRAIPIFNLRLRTIYSQNTVFIVLTSSPLPNLKPHPLCEKTDRIIVGIASLSLRADARRTGTFLPEGTNAPVPPDDPENLERDKSFKALKLMDDYNHVLEHKGLSNKLDITTLVAHPAYWRRGHGSRPRLEAYVMVHGCRIWMVWELGFSTASTGRGLDVRCGFGEVEVVKMPGYEDHPAGVGMWIGTCKVEEGVI